MRFQSQQISLMCFSLSEWLSQSLFKLETTSSSFKSLGVSEQEKSILNSIPIHIIEGRITFIHKSIQEFFVSRLWMCHLDHHHGDYHHNPSSSLLPLINTRLVAQERGILDFLSQQIHLPSHSSLLFDHVFASRTDNGAIIASSNSLTILNACRFSFSILDLSHIQVPGADLSNSMMKAIDLSHSNLKGASLHQSWLRFANLQCANLEHIQL
jgi:Pentapeptide repeats (8 copies)